MTIGSKPVALITGASAGMGRDFALRLLSEGYIVYGAARRIDRMADIKIAGGQPLAMDLTDDATMIAGVERIIREHGRIDVLVNNAGYGQMGALEDVPIDVGRRQMEVNLYGAARLVQLCLPHMRARSSERSSTSRRSEANAPSPWAAGIMHRNLHSKGIRTASEWRCVRSASM